jgi:hypothetical protein
MKLKRKGKPSIMLKIGDRAPFNSGAPICLVAYGAKNVRALETSKLGETITLNPIYRRKPTPHAQRRTVKETRNAPANTG